MKKVWLIVLAIIMLFSVAACAEQETEQEQTTDATKSVPETKTLRWSIKAENGTIGNLDAEEAENIKIIQIDNVSYEGVSIYELYKSAGIIVDESLATVYTANGDKHICLIDSCFLIISKDGEYLDTPELCFGEEKELYGEVVEIVLGTVM